MADDFQTYRDSLDSPVKNAAAVTPSNSVDLAKTTRALWVGVSGDISVEMADSGASVVFKGVQGLIPIRVTRVNSASTTATDIVALW